MNLKPLGFFYITGIKQEIESSTGWVGMHIFDQRATCVATVWGTDENSKATAEMLAAAPALLAACKRMTAAFTNGPHSGSVELNLAIEDGFDAIAEAEGRA